MADQRRLQLAAHLAFVALASGHRGEQLRELCAAVALAAEVADEPIIDEAHSALQEVLTGHRPPQAAVSACRAFLGLYEVLLKQITNARLHEAQQRLKARWLQTERPEQWLAA